MFGRHAWLPHNKDGGRRDPTTNLSAQISGSEMGVALAGSQIFKYFISHLRSAASASEDKLTTLCNITGQDIEMNLSNFSCEQFFSLATANLYFVAEGKMILNIRQRLFINTAESNINLYFSTVECDRAGIISYIGLVILGLFC